MSNIKQYQFKTKSEKLNHKFSTEVPYNCSTQFTHVFRGKGVQTYKGVHDTWMPQ